MNVNSIKVGLCCLAVGCAGRAGAEMRTARLAYVRKGDIYVQDIPDGKRLRLTMGEDAHALQWSPSGKWIAHEGKSGLRMVSTRRPLQRYVGRSSAFAWSPKDDLLAYVAQDQLPVCGTRAGSDRVLAAVSSPRYGEAPIWSPEGRHIAYAVTQPWSATASSTQRNNSRVEYRDIRLFPLDRGGPVVLLRHRGDDDTPVLAAWLPGGNLLFWTVFWGSGSVNADGSGLFVMAVRRNRASRPNPQPKRCADMMRKLRWIVPMMDTGKVVFVDGDGRFSSENKRVAVLDARTTRVTPLTPKGVAATDPALSADGSWIAYAGCPDGLAGNRRQMVSGLLAQRHIWVMDTAGRQRRQVTREKAFSDYQPHWLPGGRDLLILRERNDDGSTLSLWLWPLQGGRPRRLVYDFGRETEYNGIVPEYALWTSAPR